MSQLTHTQTHAHVQQAKEREREALAHKTNAAALCLLHNNNNEAKKFSNGEQEKCNFSFLCYFCSFAFLCVSSHCFAYLTPSSTRTHNNNPGLSLPSRRRGVEEKPFQNRTYHLRALSRPLSLTLSLSLNCQFLPLSPALTPQQKKAHTHIHIWTNKLARAYANLSKLKQPTYPYFVVLSTPFSLFSIVLFMPVPVSSLCRFAVFSFFFCCSVFLFCR